MKNIQQLQTKLLAAARAHAPGEEVPYAFEQRIMARLASRAAPEFWPALTRVFWRATAPCLAISVLLGVFTLLNMNTGAARPENSLATQFETVLYAGIDTTGESW